MVDFYYTTDYLVDHYHFVADFDRNDLHLKNNVVGFVRIAYLFGFFFLEK